MAFDNPIAITDPSGTYTYDAATFRRWQSALLGHDASLVGARPGVLHGLGLAASGLTVTLGAGSAVVTTGGGSEGSYVAVQSQPGPLTLAARDATYSRLDRIVLVIQDPETTGGTLRGAVPVVVNGTPAASPVAPTVPAGAVQLWRVNVPPTGNVSMVDERQWTATSGGIIQCTAASRPSGPYLRPGQMVYETDTDMVQRWTGSAWRMVAGGDTGNVRDITAAAGSDFVTTTTGGVAYPETRWRIRDGWAEFSFHFRAWKGGTFPARDVTKVGDTAGFRPTADAAFILRQYAGGRTAGWGTIATGSGAIYVQTESAITYSASNEFMLTMVPYRVN